MEGRSDKTKVEWAVHRNGDTYTIGTKHDSSNASSWKDYMDEQPNATVHSHPGIDIDNEISSMGYGTNFYTTDQRNVINDVRQNGYITRKSYVYFPNSSRLYIIMLHLLDPLGVTKVFISEH